MVRNSTRCVAIPSSADERLLQSSQRNFHERYRNSLKIKKFTAESAEHVPNPREAHDRKPIGPMPASAAPR